MTTILNVQSLTKQYGESPHEIHALRGVDFHVAPGELVAVMGPSGSGKSTLLEISGGLETPTSGTIQLDSIELSTLDPTGLADVRRRHVGFVFQGFNLLSGLTAAENVAAPLELDGTSAGEARSIARERLSSVGLGDRGGAFPDDLSGGERQRVAIARALVGNRRLLLADEPTGALDSATGDEVMTLIRGACTPQCAAVVVTHDRNVAEWADRVITLRDGRIDTRAPAVSPQSTQEMKAR